ncbi:hypothetical protein [Priestia flexa]|uniref:hypothetical protein n=1 Tax=Priestia flexa TaxID=86664 RepID=UPI0004743CEB|nr:hypothetical protein [Priestia flexa]
MSPKFMFYVDILQICLVVGNLYLFFVSLFLGDPSYISFIAFTVVGYFVWTRNAVLNDLLEKWGLRK